MPDFKANHWALLDLHYDYLTDGFKLTATTDVPCHLFCRMTAIPPRKHVLPSSRRGTRFTGDIRFCFVVFEDNEQEEAGDTLSHTWEKRQWPVCETRWFYFVGTQGETPSVSETAIFKLHFTKLPPLMSLSFSELWSNFINLTELLISEPWTYEGLPPPSLVEIFAEPWTYYSDPPPALSLTFTEPWTYYSEPPPILSLTFSEPWDTYLSLTLIFTEPWTS